MGHVGVIQAGTAATKASDAELVASVRTGDDAAFEQLYRRYQRRIRGFIQRRVGDPARAEDLTQEVFLSALRHLRSSEAAINFKPWLFEIARNAAIDAHRRSSRAEELFVHDSARLRPLDQVRLGEARAPDAELAAKESLDHLSGAFDELPPHHSRALVMRELEGLSYAEIGERMELTRPAVESTLFRARRRLVYEYDELVAGRRCEAARTTIGLISEGVDVGSEQRRLARHARRCTACRRRARELGVEPLPRVAALRRRVAALLPLPWLLDRRGDSDRDGSLPLGAGAEGAGGNAGTLLLGPGAQVGAALAERAAALLAAAVIAGAGGAALAVGQSDTPAAEGSHNQAVLGATPLGGAPAGTSNPLPRPREAAARRGKPQAARDGKRGSARSERDGKGPSQHTAPGTSPGAGRDAPRPHAAPGAPGLPGLPGLSGRPPIQAPGSGATNGLAAPVKSLPEAAAEVAPALPGLPATGAEDLLGKLP